MKVIDKLKEMTVEELAEWMVKNHRTGDEPWMKWFDATYCQWCDAIEGKHEGGRSGLFSFCELHGGVCKFFDHDPSIVEICLMWLESEGA